MVGSQSCAAPTLANLVIPGDHMSVRNGLRTLFDSGLLQGIPEDDRGTAEIVLAEALNNIVEHAYSGQNGEIEISLQVSTNALVCRISDSGLPMPDCVLPSGKLAEHGEREDLPEGGFGWHLIRRLSSDLKYHRESGRNHLSFRLDRKQSDDCRSDVAV